MLKYKRRHSQISLFFGVMTWISFEWIGYDFFRKKWKGKPDINCKVNCR